MNINTFSERLRETRRSKNLTQAQLAKLSGVTAATISAYESTDNKKGCNPSLDNALKLAEALDISLDWLCGSIVNKDKADTVDFLKMLVKMSDCTRISVDSVEFADKENQETLKNAFNSVVDEDTFRDYYFHCNDTGEKFSYIVNFLAFGNWKIDRFLGEWQKMKLLYNNNTIDESLYKLWLDKQFSDIEQKEKEEEEYQKELEESLKQGGE